jgi:branched-chain amino acid transport system permease protein
MLVQFFLNGLVSGSIYSLMALGFLLIFRVTNFFNFSHGAAFTVGAYANYFLLQIALPQTIAFFLPA